ncbi:MAG: hypothetical protein JRJ29_01500 [Deltaproteobacteria bacterium]|nr:hypothetical protein [Deltaproteobacteria bacterium]
MHRSKNSKRKARRYQQHSYFKYLEYLVRKECESFRKEVRENLNHARWQSLSPFFPWLFRRDPELARFAEEVWIEEIKRIHPRVAYRNQKDLVLSMSFKYEEGSNKGA